MVSDDERREVAAALRRVGAERIDRVYGNDPAHPALTLGLVAEAMGLHYAPYEVTAVELRNRLADLIEPGDLSSGRSILCAHCESAPWCGCEPGDLEGGCDFEPSVDEGEPPYNLYSLYEVVFRRRPRGECAIEDDEVRELVGALLDICNSPGHDRIAPCDTSLSCRDTVACESGQNLDTNRDTVQKESPHVAKAPECDRDALLALAEDVEEAAAMATVMDASKGSRLLAGLLSDIARRIREACGLVEGS